MEINLKSFMSEIDSSQNLFKLNICGTHDCVTKHIGLSRFAKCQEKTIYEQLNMGIRALDIRVKNNGQKLTMVHGFLCAYKTNKPKIKMDMQDVLNDCCRFLTEQKSETIIFQFKNDLGKDCEKSFDNLYNNYIMKNKDFWYLENKAPTLGDARGKIVLIRRCKMAKKAEYTNKNTGIDFSSWIEQPEKENKPLPLITGGENSVNFLIQDRYKYEPISRWEEVIKPFLDSSKPFDNEYIINYLSTAGGLKGPENNAKYINKKFMDYPLKKENYYGTIYTDFPSKEEIKKIISLNF